VVSYFLLGALIGAVTGVPIGPVNVAIIQSAYRHHVKRAIAVGLGGALGDFFYALLGILGLGQVIDAHPLLPPVLYGVSGVVLIIYGVVTVRSRPVDPTARGAAAADVRYFWSGLGLGAMLILLNPAALIAWIVVVGSALAGVEFVDGIAAAVGIFVGSMSWFTLVAYLADHGKKVLGEKALWITRVVGFLLVCFGVFSLGRAAYIVYKLS
jgi:putative LysE/RhtB family amino acid efflux pump